MPSDKMGGRGRMSIVKWRVKAGNVEVFSAEKRVDCVNYIRKNPKHGGVKCRLIRPNI